MENLSPEEEVEQIVTGVRQLVKALAVLSSAARLLTENEPLGDLVFLSLCDDALVKNGGLGHQLETIGAWLKQTEDRYHAQFPADWPQNNNHYDLTRKPDGFRSRSQVFREIVEQAESNKILATELEEHDPFVVRKRLRS